MTKNQFGIAVIFIGGIWTLACLFADTLGLGTILFGFGQSTRIGRIHLVFIFVGIFITLIGVAAMVLIEGEKK